MLRPREGADFFCLSSSGFSRVFLTLRSELTKKWGILVYIGEIYHISEPNFPGELAYMVYFSITYRDHENEVCIQRCL